VNMVTAVYGHTATDRQNHKCIFRHDFLNLSSPAVKNIQHQLTDCMVTFEVPTSIWRGDAMVQNGIWCNASM